MLSPYTDTGGEWWTASLAVFARVWPGVLGTLSSILLVNGLDDFVPIAICFWHRIFRRSREEKSGRSSKEAIEERRIAIFVPCWKEAGVIGNMVRHNLAAVSYRNYDLFLGVYPNDPATVVAVTQLARAYRNVHLAECPHPGPTSKADCLNWIYQRMILFEEEHDAFFDTIVLHDAEDLIHPEALDVINRQRAHYAMVQVPVLPLPTPIREATHGIYCDEFAEYQTIDMPARQWSGSFVPSNGVGTGFSREVLERLAAERGNLVFDPASLTEDYEIGVYIHHARQPQLFAPLRRGEKGFVATREYFPRDPQSAVRQRARWVTGIALQCWERTGWRGSWRTKYWFWRDRKGLVVSPLGLLTNILFIAGAADFFASAAAHRPWAFAVANPGVMMLCGTTLTLQCFRLCLRMTCVARIFGATFALGVPPRALLANVVNCFASIRAMRRYLDARLHGRPLVWVKTEHAYPNRDALLLHQREFGEVLVGSGVLREESLAAIREDIPEGTDLEEFLVGRGVISDEDLCKVLSLQSGVPSTHVDASRVRAPVMMTLPAHVERRFGVLPFAVEAGKLLIVGARVPSSSAFEEMKNFSRLPLEFQLITRENYEQLRRLLSRVTELPEASGVD